MHYLIGKHEMSAHKMRFNAFNIYIDTVRQTSGIQGPACSIDDINRHERRNRIVPDLVLHVRCQRIPRDAIRIVGETIPPRLEVLGGIFALRSRGGEVLKVVRKVVLRRLVSATRKLNCPSGLLTL